MIKPFEKFYIDYGVCSVYDNNRNIHTSIEGDEMQENRLKYIHINNDPQVKELAKTSKTAAQRLQGRTVSVLSVSPRRISKAIIAFSNKGPNDCVYLGLTIGIFRVHIEENYNKAVGREKATNNIKEVDLKVKHVFITDHVSQIKLEDYEGLSMSVVFNKKRNSTIVKADIIV
jgi:hypothetical protein